VNLFLSRKGRIMSLEKNAIPQAPPGFEYELLARGSSHWHQRWQVFRGVYTPGTNPVEEMLDALQVPSDLSGKRVLDIGSWNGCASFECERRGAAEVLAIGPEDPQLSGFNLLRDLTGSKRTRYEFGTCYHLDPEKVGIFDVVLFCGVLYHLRYPLLGLDSVRRVCRGEIYLETFISDADLTENTGIGAPHLPLWQFYRGGESFNDESNWFGPTACAVVQALESSGFSVQHAGKWKPQRATFRASVNIGLPEFLCIRSGEGAYYNAILEPLFGSIHSWYVPPAALSTFGRTPGRFCFDTDTFQEKSAARPRSPRSLWQRAKGKLRRRNKAA
jgi:tRNA (mo5U34)-methyltransferase